jgi:hypothetical protein
LNYFNFKKDLFILDQFKIYRNQIFTSETNLNKADKIIEEFYDEIIRIVNLLIEEYKEDIDKLLNDSSKLKKYIYDKLELNKVLIPIRQIFIKSQKTN